MKACMAFSVFAVLVALAGSGVVRAGSEVGSRFPLKDGWAIQSSSRVREKGETVSTTSFKPDGWHTTSVPSTVVAALVADKTYPDPYFGMNLRSIPGTGYPIGGLFSILPMPEDSPFRTSWWYRKEFRLPATFRGKTVWLNFDGINYRSNVWVNGKRIADAAEMAGAWREFRFNITPVLRFDSPNVLAVEVSAPQETDLGINWWDWNPTPPDKNMGLWKDVYLTSTGEVSLREPFVEADLDPSLHSAALTVLATLSNVSEKQVKGKLRVTIGTIHVEKEVEIGPAEAKRTTLSPEQFPALKMRAPQLWWPAGMGEQHLYEARLEFIADAHVSDVKELSFGIRKVTSEFTEKGYRLFRINGRRVLIRGGGWAPDMLLVANQKRMEAELRYVRDMNLNAIRLEGKLERDEFFDMTDRMGILVMPGWCCCDFFEMWDKWTPEHRKIAGASLRDQIRRLRNHPSVFVWLNGSDNPPPADVEKMYLDVLKEERWPNPIVSSASATPTSLTGPSGVKMTGPYDYVPPVYWLTDTTKGGAFGFNTETSPGPAIPTAESMRRMLPAEKLWPINEYWNYHAGGEHFTDIHIFTNALTRRYGEAISLEDYTRKSQAMAYEGERAMFEAFARNKYTSTGVIQWMLNNAWPSIIWHLYDYYLVPGGGYFGTKIALEPLHIQYSYDDRSVVVVNNEPHSLASLRARVQVYNLDMMKKLEREISVNAQTDASTPVLILPEIKGLSSTYFLCLLLTDTRGKRLSENFYWLSTKPDVLAWDKANDVYTPQSSYADFTALSTLPPVELTASSRTEEKDGQATVNVIVKNPGKSLAFMVRIRLTRGKAGEDVAPVIWQDNYFSLLPGESRQIQGKYYSGDLKGVTPTVTIDGWNAVPLSLPTGPAVQ
jgi:exo-1,4-beta-D-glucosaminidase